MHTASAMTPDQFHAWRKSLGLKQKEAADRLGLKKRMIQYYEKGDRDGRKVDIPKSVRLACCALSLGIADFDGTTVCREETEADVKTEDRTT
ncbi:helix-turn-helix transcriptional regulator [Breoghania sp.]|uniref:helix-turn-helix domain-containing protein n=1 Tax=Breoghania sp. TaxID=2065378 RepID=UPI002623F7D7|nr:helix-turn-helix transcriptional regulator [Breoghania sp.]MDJ0932598.1 helix-turn-helix transcriptional regulator [Breoghania sp.]